MEYPQTLDVRFSKLKTNDLVKEKYQLNAYLLGNIFSMVKDPGNMEARSEEESSSESNVSLYESSDQSDEDQGDSPNSSSSRQMMGQRNKFQHPMSKPSDHRDSK
jgi:hypothetical protein